MTDARLIPHRDQAALDALRLGSVVLDRRGEVWQVLLVREAALGPTRGWFRLLAGGTAHGAAAVAENGPLRVLFDRRLDIPEHVAFCSVCLGMTEEPGSVLPCSTCGGMGFFNGFDGKPLTLPEAMHLATQAATPTYGRDVDIIPAPLLVPGMLIDAYPRASVTASTHPPVRGRVETLEADAFGQDSVSVGLLVRTPAEDTGTDGPSFSMVTVQSRSYTFALVNDG